MRRRGFRQGTVPPNRALQSKRISRCVSWTRKCLPAAHELTRNRPRITRARPNTAQSRAICSDTRGAVRNAG
jgi:hypothetical protein